MNYIMTLQRIMSILGSILTINKPTPIRRYPSEWGIVAVTIQKLTE